MLLKEIAFILKDISNQQIKSMSKMQFLEIKAGVQTRWDLN
jgi:hypothetical protein